MSLFELICVISRICLSYMGLSVSCCSHLNLCPPYLIATSRLISSHSLCTCVIRVSRSYVMLADCQLHKGYPVLPYPLPITYLLPKSESINQIPTTTPEVHRRIIGTWCSLRSLVGSRPSEAGAKTPRRPVAFSFYLTRNRIGRKSRFARLLRRGSVGLPIAVREEISSVRGLS